MSEPRPTSPRRLVPIRLTPRETEALALPLLRGLENKIIAQARSAAEQSAQGHVSALLEEIDAADRAMPAVAVGTRVELTGELRGGLSWMEHLFREAEFQISILRGPELRYEAANEAFRKATGGRPLLGRTMREAFPELAGQGIFERVERVYATGEPDTRHEWTMGLERGAGVEYRSLDLVWQPLRAENGTVTGVLSLSVDVTELVSERKRGAGVDRDLKALHDAAFAAGRVLDSTLLAEFAVARASELLHADGAWLDWWDPALGALRRMATSPPSPELVPPELAAGAGTSAAAFARREPVVAERDPASAPAASGVDARFAGAIATPLLVGEQVVGTLAAGSVAARRFTSQEVRVLSLLGAQVAPAIEASRLLAEAQWAANHDAITGLPNRRSFLRKLDEQIRAAAAGGMTFAVLYADIDRFHEINDAFGHEGGDAVLRELGARIARVGPETVDRSARLGADDVAFLLRLGSDQNEAARAAQDGIQFLREPFTLSEQPVHLSASVGIAAFPAHGLSAEELLRHAEAAMFAAKRTQTRYAVYGDELDAGSQQKIVLLRDLRHALERDELTLHYQPQVDFRTNRLVGAEALLRWRHPERGMVPPLDFIPFAEETGLIHQLTPWVLKHALRQQRAWRRAGLDLRMSVNVSMRNVRDPEFLAEVGTLVLTSGVDPGSVTLEVTEAAMMLDATRTLDVLRRIRALGVNISIDDFGTGYSSLAYLSRLPVNEVKIDRTFVMDLTTPRPRAIVQAVIELGRVFGLLVVAEGVKDEATWDQLKALGCDIAQGYHLSEPLAADAFQAWANRHTGS